MVLAAATRRDELRERGERLRRAIEPIGSGKVAKDSGVPYTTLRGYMAGGDMKLSIVAAVARACGVTIDWIAHGDGHSAEGGDVRPSPETGGGDPDPINMAWLGRRLGLDTRELVSFVAHGDAMSPAIREGDLLIAQVLEQTVIAPAVYAIEIGGSLMARRLEQRVDGALVVRTDNPRYETQVLEKAKERAFRVVGPVVWHAGPIRS